MSDFLDNNRKADLTGGIITKTTLYLIRHAEAEGNINRVFHGWTDSNITDIGHKQAVLLSKRIEKFKIDVLYSSTLKRAVQTAQYISDIKSLPIIKREDLKEINGGNWEGMLWEELPKIWPEEYDTWENNPLIHRMPEGESMDEFMSRLVKELKTIISENEGKNICIVTHGTAIRVLMSYFYFKNLNGYDDISWCDNTAITVAEYSDGKINVISEGDSTHLTEGLRTIEKQGWWKEKQEKIINTKTLEGENKK